MGWDLSVYLECRDQSGKWHLASCKNILSKAKDIIDWESCGWDIKVDECSEDLQRVLYNDRKECHDGAIPFNPGMSEYSEADWANDKSAYALKLMDTEYLQSEVDACSKFVEMTFNAAFRASGCPFTSDEMDGTDFYSEKYDHRGNVSKQWNPMTYPINKDLFCDLQSAYFKQERVGKLRMLLSIADSARFTWLEGTEYKHGDARFIVEYT